MKKTTILLLLLTILTMPFALANVATSTALDASLLNYQPVPAQPGDLVDVWVQINNNGGTTSRAGTITFLESENFRLETSADRVKEFQPVPGRSSFLVRTQVRVSKDANEGEAMLRVRVQEEGSTSSIDRMLPITITGTKSTISVMSATTQPDNILPGEQGTLTIQLRNVGDTEVRNLAVSLNFMDLPLAPVGASNSQALQTLSGGSSTTLEFPITAMPGASADVYQLPITLSYDDERGSESVQEETIGVVIGANPQLLVYFDRVNINQEQKQGDVVLRFVNHGLSEIKLLQFEVLESDDIKVTSESPILYVGNIRADDYRSASLSLRVSENEQTVPVRVTYKDSLNKEYSEVYNVNLMLQESNTGGFGFGTVVLLLVIVVAGVWLYRRRAKKNKKR